MIDTLWQFIGSLGDTQIMLIALGCMLVFGVFGWLATGSPIVGIVVAESINCWNLTTILISPLIGLDAKPFYPLWMTLLILFVPVVILFIPRMFCSGASSPSVKEETK